MIYSTPYSLKDCLSVFGEMGVDVGEMIACGGGGSSKLWRQMLADIYNCEIATIASKEGPALGVALLAGVGAGIYNSVPEACDAAIRKGDVQLPNADNTEIYTRGYNAYRQVYPALKDIYGTLSTI